MGVRLVIVSLRCRLVLLGAVCLLGCMGVGLELLG